MERLTFFENGRWWIRLNGHMYGGFPEVDRLAAYEDTGLEPEEAAQIKIALMGKALAEIKEFEEIPISCMIELAQAEKDGRLVVLPCKVGDEVYFPVTGKWNVATINRIEIRSVGKRFCWVRYNSKINKVWDEGWFTEYDIGETVFLSAEEAEAERKKREEADNEVGGCG